MAGGDGEGEREKKRAQALRANLKRRKAQQRGRREQGGDTARQTPQTSQDEPNAGSND